MWHIKNSFTKKQNEKIEIKKKIQKKKKVKI